MPLSLYMSLKCLENGQFQLLGPYPSVFGGANCTDRTRCGAPVKATELNFQDFGGQNLLFFAYF